MITDSSRNYLDSRILLIWEGERPTVNEVEDYMSRNYGSVENYEFVIEDPSEGYGGYTNPGKVYIEYKNCGPL